MPPISGRPAQNHNRLNHVQPHLVEAHVLEDAPHLGLFQVEPSEVQASELFVDDGGVVAAKGLQAGLYVEAGPVWQSRRS